MKKVVVITGGNSGIGACVVDRFINLDYQVYELSKSGKSKKGVTHFDCDVTDVKRIKEVINNIYKETKRIDILINNAGFGISGAIEYVDLDLAHKQLDVNFWGVVNVTKEVLPIMRKQGFGRIVNTSSLGAPAALPFQAYYSVSKSGINTFTCALDNEVKKFGIRVSAVMPGDTKTNFTQRREKVNNGNIEYDGVINNSVKRMENDEQNGMSADDVAKKIVSVSLKKNPKPLYTVGFVNKLLYGLLKLLPVRLSNKLIGSIYVK